MNRSIPLLLLAALSFLSEGICAQGWYARVELYFGGGSAPLVSADDVYVLFSGATAYTHSGLNEVTVHLYGTGVPSGTLYVTAYGRNASNELASVSVSHDPPVEYFCEPIFLDIYGNLNEHVTGSLTIYPRLEIENIAEECDRVTLETYTCTSTYVWEVAENPNGPFTRIGSGPSRVISFSGEQLSAVNLSPYGLKYVRATGMPGTTSLVAPVYVYAPPPEARFSVHPPACHNGSDGSISVQIHSSYPSVIDDFVLFLKNEHGEENAYVLNDADEMNIGGLRPGQYTIRIQNNSMISTYGSCESVLAAGTVTNPPKVAVASAETSDYNGFAISCDGASDGWMNITAAGGTGTFPVYQWTPQVGSGSRASDLAPGTYQVVVLDDNGCASDPYLKTLNAPDKLDIQLHSTGGKGGYGVSCHDKRDGRIVSEISGGAGGYQFLWMQGSQSSALESVGPGSYELTVTDRNGCAETQVITLSAPEPIEADVREITAIRCAGDETGAIEVHALQHTLGEVSYLWSSGESTRDIYAKAAGAYSVTVNDEQGCTATAHITLQEPPAWSVDLTALSDYNGWPVSCAASADALLEAHVFDAQGIAREASLYTWYKNESELATGTTPSRLDGATAGRYTIRILYNEVCEAGDSVVLKAPPALEPELRAISNYNGFPLSCADSDDGRLQASAVGGTGNYVYLWSDGESGATRSGLVAGDYTVRVRDSNGCEVDAASTLHAPPGLEASIEISSNYNGMAISCAGATDGRLRATASGGVPTYTYAWSNGVTEKDLSGIGAEKFTVRIRDANGCEASAEKILTAPDPLVATLLEVSDFGGYGVSCYAARDGYLRVGATGGTGVHKYTWDNSLHSAPLYENLSAGHYRVTVTDQNGCPAQTTAALYGPERLMLSATAIAPASCAGGSDGKVTLHAAGGAGAYVFSLSTSGWQRSNVVSDLRAGDYEAWARDGNGCQQQVAFQITEPAPLEIQVAEILPALCQKSQGSATASATGGTVPYTYRWEDATGLAVSDLPTISGLNAGLYYVTVADGNACEIHESVGITSTDGPSIAIERAVDPGCSDKNDGIAGITITRGDGPFEIVWDDGQTGLTALALGSGTHVVAVTDVNGCTSSASVMLEAPAPLRLVVEEASSPSCHGFCDGRITVNAEGGNGGYAFTWSHTSGREVSNICAGDYNVVVSDQNNCQATGSVTLTDPLPLEAKVLTIRSPSCQDTCDGLLSIEPSGGTGAVTTFWNAGESTPSLTGLCEGTYTATLMDANGCVASHTVMLEDPPAIALDLGGSITLCEGQHHLLDVGSFWQRQYWGSTAGLDSDLQQITVSDPGLYWVETITHDGCIARDTFELMMADDLLAANFLLASEALVLDTVVAIDISWPIPEHTVWVLPEGMKRLDSATPDILFGQFQSEGTYEVRLRAFLGECRDELTKSILIRKPDEGEPDAAGRLDPRVWIRELSLWPNPNDGMFDVDLVMERPAPIRMTIWNLLSSRRVALYEGTGLSRYTRNFDLRPLGAGSYVLRLDHPGGTAYLRFIVR